MKKPKRYVDLGDSRDNLESFVIGFQNVFYIVTCWLFGYFFAKTNNILFIFIIIIPIIFKVSYDAKEKRVRLKIFR